jgi:hypothetical protein
MLSLFAVRMFRAITRSLLSLLYHCIALIYVHVYEYVCDFFTLEYFQGDNQIFLINNKKWLKQAVACVRCIKFGSEKLAAM